MRWNKELKELRVELIDIIAVRVLILIQVLSELKIPIVAPKQKKTTQKTHNLSSN